LVAYSLSNVGFIGPIRPDYDLESAEIDLAERIEREVTLFKDAA
jgi:hypothetical protein